MEVGEPSGTASAGRRLLDRAPTDGRRLPGDPHRLPGTRPRRRPGLLRCRPRPRGRVAARAAALARLRTRPTTAAFVRDPDGNNIEAVCIRARVGSTRPAARTEPVARLALSSSERRHEVVQHRRAQVLLRRRQRAGRQIGRRLGRLRQVERDPVRRVLTARTGIRPRATPGGSWKPTATAEILVTCSRDALAAGTALPRSCCVAAWAALNSGHASCRPLHRAAAALHGDDRLRRRGRRQVPRRPGAAARSSRPAPAP